nr:phage terminase large subunit [Campylobacterota bacterium]
MSDDLKYPLKLSDLIVDNVDIDVAPNKLSYSSMPDQMLYVKHNGFKQDKLYQPSFRSEDTREYEQRVMMIDPSGRGKDEVGYAVGFMSLGRLFTKVIGGLKGGYDRQTLMALLEVAKANKVDVIVIESNFGDGAFAQILEPLMDEMKLGIRLDEVRAVGQKEKRIINTLEPLMNQHKIVIDKGIFDNDNGNGINNSFSYQLTHITFEPNALVHDDRLDAFALLCQYVVESFNVLADSILEQEEEESLSDVYNALFD